MGGGVPGPTGEQLVEPLAEEVDVGPEGEVELPADGTAAEVRLTMCGLDDNVIGSGEAALEDGDDIEVKGDDVMALLEEVDGEDARKESDAHRKAGRTAARRAEPGLQPPGAGQHLHPGAVPALDAVLRPALVVERALCRCGRRKWIPQRARH